MRRPHRQPQRPSLSAHPQRCIFAAHLFRLPFLPNSSSSLLLSVSPTPPSARSPPDGRRINRRRILSFSFPCLSRLPIQARPSLDPTRRPSSTWNSYTRHISCSHTSKSRPSRLWSSLLLGLRPKIFHRYHLQPSVQFCPSGNIGVELLPSNRNHHYRGSPGSRATLLGHCYIASHSVISGRFDTIDEEKEKKYFEKKERASDVVATTFFYSRRL
ncbi:hypothetical protein BJ166DRAFT_363122 [Pestalotiopsis sp. NC0098]|nr:hypothetical protein BJ166DRAFT_363122 [Pestalotiopsis sp. NC0098]